MKPLVGYEWHEGRSKQVAYISQDHHLHELSVAVGGSWQHSDLTALASAPRAINRFLVGYEWPEGGSKQMAYLGQDGHIQELSIRMGETWQHSDLNSITGAPPAIAVTSGYSWSTGRSKQVVFVGDDEHIHELSVAMGESWQHVDLTASANAPRPDSKYMVGYQWQTGQCKQVAYVSQDGHIHELFLESGKRWQHADLSSLTSAPRATDLMVGYEWQEERCKQVVFVSEDGHIHELFLVAGNTWAHVDLNALTHAPLATDVLTGYAWPQGRTKHIAYAGQDGYLHELFIETGGTWQHVNLTERANAPITPVTSLDAYVWSMGGLRQVAYVGDDGEIREVWIPQGGDWAYANLSQMVMASPVRF
jgi:hypothetical protein